MTGWKRRRFWKQVAVTGMADTEAADTEAAGTEAAGTEAARGGFAVELDGRRLRTPAKAVLALPTRALAEAVAAEWAAQKDEIDPATMPFTRMANAAIDRVAPQFGEIAAMIAAYGDSDLLCYRAEHPQGLAERQAAQWDPALDWARTALGARLEIRRGVVHRPQDPAALARLAGHVRALDPFRLTALHDLVCLTGSLILGLAAARGWRDAESLWRLSRLDEIWQQEQWGVVEEAAHAETRKRSEFMHAKRFFDAATPEGAADLAEGGRGKLDET